MQHTSSNLSYVLTQVTPPPGITIRAWEETDFPAIQHLSTTEYWPTPATRPEEALQAWQSSKPTLVAVDNERVIGFLRALSDGCITLYITELLVDPAYRGRGIGRLLLDICHLLYPRCRVELTSLEASQSFYESHGFRKVGIGLRKSYFK